jgi:hypothetical protein
MVIVTLVITHLAAFAADAMARLSTDEPKILA